MKHSLFDPRDLFIGHMPVFFLLEVLVRMVFLYGVLLVAMRFMGRRMSSQLTRNEMLSLAAAIGPALQDPTRGLLPPLVIAICVVALQQISSGATDQRFVLAGDGRARQAGPIDRAGVGSGLGRRARA